MAIITKQFVRKPIRVDAVRVTADNFVEIAFWVQGSIRNNDDTPVEAGTQIDPSSQHIKLNAHNPKNTRQTQAYVDDWVLKSDKGFKIYNHEAFMGSFDLVEASGPALEFSRENVQQDNEPIETEALPEDADETFHDVPDQTEQPPPVEADPPAEPEPTEPVVPAEEPVTPTQA